MLISSGGRRRVGSVKGSVSMNGIGAGVIASKVGQDPMGAYLRAPRSLAEIEQRIDRGRQIVARQRELVARVGERIPSAVTLLKTFESTLALFERARAVLQRSQALRAEAGQAVLSDRAAAATRAPNRSEPGEAICAKPDDEEKMSAIARIMEILREGGYHCELERETLH